MCPGQPIMHDFLISLLSGRKGNSTKSGISPEDRITIATCVILLEMAGADSVFSQSERNKIRELLQNSIKLPPDEIEGILSIAEREREESVDLWAYTNLINEHFAAADKRRLVEMVWELAYADGRLDQNEDYLMHKLANLLNLKHEDLIAAKLKAISSGRR
jgi:uncharacterized tellurite resistance protein B-like protein